MNRHFPDWLTAYVEYASFGEAPKHMHFWCGVSAIAGALRRKVFIDQAYFKWYPNQYLVLVAPPGIVSKSTTAGIAMKLLKQVPGVKFGPDVVTWPALVTSFAEAKEAYEYAGEWHEMCAMTLESSEFGNLLNPQDREMVDLLVSLWDGKQGAFNKKTKHSGSDEIVNPWINMIGCTTPSWIAGNFPEYVIGGGFTSRCLFVYADTKDKFVAYPGLEVPATMKATELKLVQDLEKIGALCGEYRLTPAAIEFGTKWYRHHFDNRPEALDEDRFGGYIARKQTHLHKLAMILSASRGSSMMVDVEDLITANRMISDLEKDMPLVFSKIGRSDASIHAERLAHYIDVRRVVSYSDCYRFVHANFPAARDFEEIMQGLLRSGQVEFRPLDNKMMVYSLAGKIEPKPPAPAVQSAGRPQSDPP